MVTSDSFLKNPVYRLFLEHLSQQTADHTARGVATSGVTAEEGTQHIDDVAAGILLAQHREKVRGDRSQDVGHLVVRSVGLAAQSRNDGAKIASENLLQNLVSILDIDDRALTCMAGQCRKQRSGITATILFVSMLNFLAISPINLLLVSEVMILFKSIMINF